MAGPVPAIGFFAIAFVPVLAGLVRQIGAVSRPRTIAPAAE